MKISVRILNNFYKEVRSKYTHKTSQNSSLKYCAAAVNCDVTR